MMQNLAPTKFKKRPTHFIFKRFAKFHIICVTLSLFRMDDMGLSLTYLGVED